MSKLEARVANAEMAVVALATLIKDMMPSAIEESVNRCMRDFFDASQSLGGFPNRGSFIAREELDDRASLARRTAPPDTAG